MPVFSIDYGESFSLKYLEENTSHSDITTLHYNTLKNTLLIYTTVKCSLINSPFKKKSEQTNVVSQCQIRYKTMSELTLNILNYTK